MIKENYKIFISKLLFLFLILVLMLIMVVDVTYCRYLTQSNCNIKYLSANNPTIYMDSMPILNRTLFQVSNWQSSLNQTSAEFTLCNLFDEATQLPKKDIRFCIRAYVVKQENDDMQESLPVSVTISAQDKVYQSQVENIMENTAFYKKIQSTGQVFCFYDSDKQAISEQEFCLKGSQNSQLTFTLTVYNSQAIAEQMFLYIEKLG